MDSRWRNLLGIAAVLLVLLLAWLLFFNAAPVVAGSAIGSFETGLASLQGALISLDSFDAASGSFATDSQEQLQADLVSLQDFRSALAAQSSFEGKDALLDLSDMWLAKLRFSVALSDWQQKDSVIVFSGTESDAQICARRSDVLELRGSISDARNALQSFVDKKTGVLQRFPSQATAANLVADSVAEEELAGLEAKLSEIDSVLEGC